MAASEWAGLLMTHDSISPTPDYMQLISYALLLHSILGYESILAGAWYVAIDFQLYAVLVLLLWLSARLTANRALPWLMFLLVAILSSASLLYFNRNSSWDIWALYFFGSYGLGILAWWASDPSRQPSSTAFLLAAMLIPTLIALVIDYRSRIAVALALACCLALMGRHRAPWLDRSSLVNGVGEASYSIFLIHFPVCLIVNAIFTRFAPAQPLWQAGGMLAAWMTSLAMGIVFYRWVEQPLASLFLSFKRVPLSLPSLQKK